MKKFFSFFLMFGLHCIGQVSAGNVLIVSDVDVPQGGQTAIEVGCEFDTDYTAFELQIALPEGVSLLTDEDGYPVIEKAFDSNHVLTGNLLPSNGNYKVTCRSMDNISMPTSGPLFRVIVQADAGLALGANLAASITACEFTRTTDSNGESLEDVDFTVHITEFRTILDETSALMPEAETNANVRLNRTMKAGVWSTICLPFDATGEQVKSAFGNDVELAEFKAWNSEEDDEGAIVGINVEFASVNADDGIAANTPMIIKTTTDVTSAVFDDVTLDPEDEPFVQVGRKSSERAYFYGTYVSMKVPEEHVFLKNNMFWYSTGNTTIKGYRGYFAFRDVLDAYYDVAGVRFSFFLDNVETSIDGLKEGKVKNEKLETYNLAGQRIRHTQRGVNIINGKKIVKR